MKKVYYTIGEVCEMLDLKPHIIRYWETEFSQLRSKSKKGTIRRYTEKEINFIDIIRKLIYEKKFTLEGAHEEIRNMQHSDFKLNNDNSIESNRFKNELLQIKNILLNRKN
ncbi:MAG: MerR family transcriptional regulator [Candidatus Cloacimonetes bacterium]|jgi:DNA-binding transcriptional MerR regulator|nr:MerR family transcriptional regulator [Candidatus Cloacimonadota bacterium]MDD4156664.1 MerR family transcriptional regulator [Candidatus Cloacimonadota bacterium]